jgi:hypothetical protein
MPIEPPFPGRTLVDILRSALDEARRLAEQHPRDARIHGAKADIKSALARLEAPERPDTAA